LSTCRPPERQYQFGYNNIGIYPAITHAEVSFRWWTSSTHPSHSLSTTLRTAAAPEHGYNLPPRGYAPTSRSHSCGKTGALCEDTQEITPKSTNKRQRASCVTTTCRKHHRLFSICAHPVGHPCSLSIRGIVCLMRLPACNCD
jgi:hypothetical protein